MDSLAIRLVTVAGVIFDRVFVVEVCLVLFIVLRLFLRSLASTDLDFIDVRARSSILEEELVVEEKSLSVFSAVDIENLAEMLVLRV